MTCANRTFIAIVCLLLKQNNFTYVNALHKVSFSIGIDFQFNFLFGLINDSALFVIETLASKIAFIQITDLKARHLNNYNLKLVIVLKLQGDQMARLFLNIWPFTSMKISPLAYKSRQQSVQKLNKKS